MGRVVECFILRHTMATCSYARSSCVWAVESTSGILMVGRRSFSLRQEGMTLSSRPLLRWALMWPLLMKMDGVQCIGLQTEDMCLPASSCCRLAAAVSSVIDE